MDVDAVTRAMERAHREAIGPRFGALQAGEVEQKSPGEVVTVADREAEAILTEALGRIVDAPVVGEEAAAADPSLLDLVTGSGPLWLVDPIDGTGNFAAGRPEYAVMVAFLDGGGVEASWILQPELGRRIVARRGAGVTVDGRPVRVPSPPDGPATWRGVVKDRFLPDDTRRSVDAALGSLGPRHHTPHCAGVEYPDLVAGEHDYLLYWRTLPWDHVPGALVAEEAGCLCLRPDGSPYRVDRPGDGLLVAPAPIAESLRRRLFG